MNVPVVFSLMAFFLWGVWGFLGKLASAHLTPRQLILFSTLGYIIMFPLIFLFLRKGTSLNVVSKGAMLAIVSGVFSAAAYVCYYIAISKGEVSRIVTITALYPLVTCILAFIFIKEPLTVSKIAGIILATTGIVLLSR